MDVNTFLSNHDYFLIFTNNRLILKSFDFKFRFHNNENSVDISHLDQKDFTFYFEKYDILKYDGNIRLKFQDQQIYVYYKDFLINNEVTSLESIEQEVFATLALLNTILYIQNRIQQTDRICFENKIKKSDLLFELKEFAKCFLINKEKSEIWLIDFQ